MIYNWDHPCKVIFIGQIAGEMNICNQNIAGLGIFGSTFRNTTMLISVIKIQDIMWLNRRRMHTSIWNFIFSVFNIPKDMSTRTYVIAWTRFFLQTNNKGDATLDPERIPGWNTYFYFTVWTPNRTILNGLTDMFGFCFCVCV